MSVAGFDMRAHLHGMWAAVAPSWEEHAEYAEARGAAVAQQMLASTAPQPGGRVLELACGPGGLGLAAAELIGPGGEVVLTDVVAEMTSIAARRARERNLTNVRTREIDIDAISEPDSSYDIVLCREGVMFATDPAAAMGNIARVLRPGGRAAIAVWGPRERNPWLGLVFDAVAEVLQRPVPAPGIPSPFDLGDRDELAALLTGAGLDDVGVEEISVPLRAGSFEEWWTRTSSLAGPLAKILESLPEQARDALAARLREAVAPYETEDGLELPGVALLASGRRAS